MKLNYLLDGLEYELLQGSLDQNVENICYHTGNMVHNCLFVCMKGAKQDSHQMLDQIIENGANVLVVEQPVALSGSQTVLLVSDTRKALALLSKNWFENPFSHLISVGITGTKGKTTVAFMIFEILRQAGYKPGLIGTVETIIGEKHTPSEHTTPQSYEIYQMVHEMVQIGCTHVIMEVSSQGLKQNRTFGIQFNVGVFTNLSPDHIGPTEHPDLCDYIQSKSRLFQQCDLGIINQDDPLWMDILKNHTCDIITYGIQPERDYYASQIQCYREQSVLGITYELSGRKQEEIKVSSPGMFSVYNSLSAITVCDVLHVSMDVCKQVLLHIQVLGRVEIIPLQESYTVIVDYAHNEMSLRSLLETLKEYNPSRLICMFGCGGNRSKLRRGKMGEVSAKLCDLTVVTSDNPRYEEPEAIMADIIEGVKIHQGNYVAIPNRKDAVCYCLSIARKGDILVFAGKGHETYQEIYGIKYQMDEHQLIQQAYDMLKQKRFKTEENESRRDLKQMIIKNEEKQV